MVVDVVHGIDLHMFALVEEVFVHALPPKQPEVTVVGDGALSEAGRLQEGTLGLGFQRTHDVRDSKHPQQVLREAEPIRIP